MFKHKNKMCVFFYEQKQKTKTLLVYIYFE